MHFRIELSLEELSTLVIAIEAASRFNIGQLDIAHEMVAPASNSKLMREYEVVVKNTKRLMSDTRSTLDDKIHAQLECLMHNLRSTYHNYTADQRGEPQSRRASFTVYDGPEVLGLDKIKIEVAE